MARLNRPTFPFIGLLIAIGSASGVGCGFDTHGSPTDTTSTGATGGSGGIGGEGGMAGMGGMAGAGGAMVCKPATTQPCYSGPANTPNIGTCKAGKQTCLADGTGYGVCEGEVVPTLENCVMVGDEDCDGLTDIEDSECKCTTPGPNTACDTGLLGVCRMGTGTCTADGRAIDSCIQSQKPTPENCTTPEDDDCDGVMAATCTGVPISTFTVPSGAGTTKDDAIFSVALTSDGGSVIAGVVDGTISAGGYDVTAGTVYIAKLDANHVKEWEKKYSAASYAVARGVAVDKDGNIIVAGSFNGDLIIEGTTLVSDKTDIFFIKLNSLGTVLWTKSIPAANSQHADSVAVDGNGNCYITGSTDDNVDFGGGSLTTSGTDVFVASYGTDNAYRWSKLYASGGSQFGRAITTTSNGDVVFIGDTGDDIDLGGGTITKGGNLDLFVARYAGADGAFVWGKLFGKTMDQVGRGVAMAADGNVLITGGFEGTIEWKPGTSMTKVGTSDVYVAKLDGLTGNYITHVNGGKTGTSIGSSVGSDAAGNVTVFGHFNGSIQFGAAMPTVTTNVNDTFLVKLNANDWSHVWTKPYGKMGNQFGWSVAVAKDGSAVTGGGFYTEFEVPPNAILQSTGGSDIFAVFTNP